MNYSNAALAGDPDRYAGIGATMSPSRILLNDRPLVSLWTLPVGTQVEFGRNRITILRHDQGEDNDKTEVRSASGHVALMDDVSLVHVVKAPPTWYP